MLNLFRPYNPAWGEVYPYSRLRKKSVLHLILGGAAVHVCFSFWVAQWFTYVFDFGWRSGSPMFLILRGAAVHLCF
jgi:hypothetical protein